ncbi:hypothetical protein LGN46_27305 [Burkholderia arboris]|nr:hypothetical protein [Burkholderia arboris]MCA8493661.1 hypothetical protein [Burkholderia arboris]
MQGLGAGDRAGDQAGKVAGGSSVHMLVDPDLDRHRIPLERVLGQPRRADRERLHVALPSMQGQTQFQGRQERELRRAGIRMNFPVDIDEAVALRILAVHRHAELRRLFAQQPL